MSDNTTLNPGADGDVAVTREISHAGDTAKLQGVFAMGISGSEGAYTAAAINGDATNGLDVDVTRVGGNVTVVQGTAANLNVTAELGATDNAVLDAIAASLAALDNAVGGNELQVDVLTLPNATVVGAAAEDAAASGNPVLVGGRYDSSPRTLETGDVGALALNASGQLLVEIAAGAGSGGTAAADDADFTDGTTSFTPIGGVYESSPSSVTDGDMGMAGITETRSLKVHVTGIAGSQTDDAAFTPGTSLVSVIGAEFDDTTPDSVDEGDGGALRMSANRNLYMTIRDAAGNERGVNINASNQLAVAGPVTNAGTFAVQVDGNALTALQLIDDPVATLGTTTYTETTTKGMIVGAVRRDADTTLVDTTNEIGPLQMDANGRLKVEAFSGETLPVSLAALPASTNTLEVVGDVAHDAGVAGNPVQIGGYATNNIEGVTQVAAADLTRTVHDLNGVQVVRPHTTLEEIQSVRTTNTDGNSTSLVAAAGSGVHNYLSTITIWNSSSTDGFVDLRDGTGGAVLYTLPAPQTGGCTVSFPVPLKFGDNTAIAFDASGAINTIYISAVFFQAQG